jgi:hypothetical protein
MRIILIMFFDAINLLKVGKMNENAISLVVIRVNKKIIFDASKNKR